MRVLVFLADGFEEVEALTVVDYLRRVDIKVDLVSITNSRHVFGAHDIEVRTDKTLNFVDENDYDGLVIPGGMPGATNLSECPEVIEFVQTMNKQKKLIAAICAGPIVLAKANLIEGRKITSYPGFESQLLGSTYVENPVVRDDNFITARGPFFAVDFVLEIVDYLLGDKEVSKLKEDLLYVD